MLDLIKVAQQSRLRVYFAGKVNERYGVSTWRERFGVKKPHSGQICMFDGSEFVYSGPTICGKADDENRKPHATMYYKHSMLCDTKELCIREIDDADLVVAVVDDGCYGTMWELGYCHATSKESLIRVLHDDCWFAEPFQVAYGHGCDLTDNDSVHQCAMQQLSAEFSWLLRCHENVRDMLQSSQSPLETAVAMQWALAWRSWNGESDLLWAQVSEGPYRIDFANRQCKLAIELDGYSYHSSREQFGKDRERERFLIEKGWKVIRFHGDEIRSDVKKVVSEIRRHVNLRRDELAGA